MRPWARIKELMDAVPEEKRRLIGGVAWSPVDQCGCIFGTLFPDTPKDTGSTTSMDFRSMFQYVHSESSQWEYAKEAEAFQAWARGLGLTYYDVWDLQEWNDTVHDLPKVRWDRVYAWVCRREQKEEIHE